VVGFFTQCRDSLDQHYDRRERIIKANRDITALSKKLIFVLHRVQIKTRATVLLVATDKKNEIVALFEAISHELEDANYYKYLRSISPAIQEYIEAIAFMEYVYNGKLITKEACEADFVKDGQPFLKITDDDYVLGVADLTGELMRYAINSVGKGNHDLAIEVCRFMRSLKGEYDALTLNSRSPISNKVDVMRSSLRKVEDACYALRVRGSEYPASMYQGIIREQQQRFGVEVADE